MSKKPLTPVQQFNIFIKGKDSILKELLLAELMRLNDLIEKKSTAKNYMEEVSKRVEARMKENEAKSKTARNPKPKPKT